MDEHESLQRAIHEKVALGAYDPRWPLMFEEERNRLSALFPDDFMAIEHIGSTAVPGLRAKPIIDVLAGVESIARGDLLMDPLCRSMYVTSAEFNATLKNRRWLMRWADGRRTHHLHLVEYRGPEWSERLAFRDMLRSDLGFAARYEQLKARLAKDFSDDREAYTAAKSQFVREAISNGAR